MCWERSSDGCSGWARCIICSVWNKSTNGVSLPFYVRLVKCIRRGEELSWLTARLSLRVLVGFYTSSTSQECKLNVQSWGPASQQKWPNTELLIFHTLNVHNSHSQLSLIDAWKQTKYWIYFHLFTLVRTQDAEVSQSAPAPHSRRTKQLLCVWWF